mmetsp:Transcript_14463/g.23007  ORF Transcript_14463/g.23007 Transcript_14463/m.23007 type:complete len:107 (+) Transcript_14463:69-389(+)
MLPEATTIFDLSVSAVALIQLLYAASSLRSKGPVRKKNIFLWLSILLSTTFIVVMQGFPRGYFSLPWRVWNAFFAAMGVEQYYAKKLSYPAMIRFVLFFPGHQLFW